LILVLIVTLAALLARIDALDESLKEGKQRDAADEKRLQDQEKVIKSLRGNLETHQQTVAGLHGLYTIVALSSHN
jgi:hypothetical protein